MYFLFYKQQNENIQKLSNLQVTPSVACTMSIRQYEPKQLHGDMSFFFSFCHRIKATTFYVKTR